MRVVIDLLSAIICTEITSLCVEITNLNSQIHNEIKKSYQSKTRKQNLEWFILRNNFIITVYNKILKNYMEL